MLEHLNEAEDNSAGTLPLDLDISPLSLEHQKDADIESPIIKVCEDGTLTTKIRLPNGKEVYLGMERIDIDQKSLDNWDIYTETSIKLAMYLAAVANKLGCVTQGVQLGYWQPKLRGIYMSEDQTEKLINKACKEFANSSLFQKESGFSDEDFKPGFQKSIGLEGKEFDEFVNIFKNSLAKYPKIIDILRGIQSGAISFCSDWITYASNEPITCKFQVKSDPSPINTFKLLAKDFNRIIISVRTAEYPDLPTYQNRAIFKNPYWVIKGEYPKLSMTLHSFTAKVAQEFWTDKIYMTVAPRPEMQEIILKSFKKGEVFIGDNLRKPYPDLSPIVHRYGDIIKIATEGVDTSDFPNSELPDELTQFTHTVDPYQFEKELTPGHAGDEYPNYIKIEALASKFPEF